MKTCVFCRRSPPQAKITNEHVMRSALRKYAGPMLPVVRWNTIQSPPAKRVFERLDREFPGTAFDWKVNNVCKECNEGWLNYKIEIPAEPILAALMQGLRVDYTKANLKLVATWAAKTAAVRALMDPPPSAVPAQHYDHIMQHLEPPPLTGVWLIHSEYCMNSYMRHQRFVVRSATDGEEPSAHITSIVYGHMGILVLGASHIESAHLPAALSTHYEERDTLRIWPDARTTMWPMPQMPLALIKQLGSATFAGLYPDTENLLD